VSPARDPLTPAMHAGMLRALRDTVVGERCGCGDSFCDSFWRLGWLEADDLFTVRFQVNGELHVTCDGQGVTYQVQWLCNEARGGNTSRCYLTSAGWSQRDIADA
jgi:hypothetical protein